MVINEPKNRNYCATVVSLDKFVELENCSNVKAALIFGHSVIVSRDAQPGDIGLFFPVETTLSKEFLGPNNLFRKPEWGNADPEKKGFFEEHGRVKAMKFRGHKSEGFWIPLNALTYTGVAVDQIPVGAEFDHILDKEICRKYVPKGQRSAGPRKVGTKAARVEDQIIDGQFRFHVDTENLRRNVHKVHPNDFVAITEKWHGSSAVFANVLVERPLKWYERLLRWAGVNISEVEYGVVWSSRRVVKGVAGQAKDNARHFYESDIWGVVAQEIADLIPKGYTLYGEIVGYTPDGAAIQKDYHYGCQPGQHRFLIYRVTHTNDDGEVSEFTWNQVTEFCRKRGLEHVKTLYYGRAGDWYSGGPGCDDREWQEGFLDALHREWVHDQMCPANNFEVPFEGIVVKVEKLEEAEMFKLKCFKFLESESKALDQGVVDTETAESDLAEAA